MNAPSEKAVVVDENCLDKAGLPDSDSRHPEGGLKAWLTVLGSFLIQIGGFGFVHTFGVFQDFYSRHYLTNVSSSTISWIGSTNSFLILSAGLLFGPLYDRGYFYWLVIGGCSLQSICLFMLSLTQHDQFYQVFLCQGLGYGLAASMSYVPSLAVLSHHFKGRRTIAMSIATGGSSIGSIGYTILLSKILNSKLGFANSIRITAAATTVLLSVGCVLMRNRPSYPKTQTRYSRFLKSSSVDYPYTFASTGMFLFGAGSFFPIFYIQMDSSMHRLGNEFSFYTIVILNGANFIGHITAGFIAKYCGISNGIIVSTLSAGIVTFATTALSTRVGAASIGALFGYFAGFYVALAAPLIAHLTHDLSEIGARMGISFFMAGLGSLVGTPIAGALLGSHHRWWRPAVFCGCFCVTGTVWFVIMRLVLQHKRQVVPVSS